MKKKKVQILRTFGWKENSLSHVNFHEHNLLHESKRKSNKNIMSKSIGKLIKISSLIYFLSQ